MEKHQKSVSILDSCGRLPEVKVSVLWRVHLHPAAILSVELIVGASDPGLLADRDVIRPGREVLVHGVQDQFPGSRITQSCLLPT